MQCAVMNDEFGKITEINHTVSMRARPPVRHVYTQIYDLSIMHGARRI